MCELTDEEVKETIKQAGIEETKQEETFKKMQENYDGYRFSKYNDTHLFNTTLVMYYLRDLIRDRKTTENLVDGNLAATGRKIENIAGLINREANYEILNELMINREIVANEQMKRYLKDKRMEQKRI